MINGIQIQNNSRRKPKRERVIFQISKSKLVTLERAREIYNSGSVAMFDFDTIIMRMIKSCHYQIGKATADYLQLLNDISKRKGISVRKAESLFRSAGSK